MNGSFRVPLTRTRLSLHPRNRKLSVNAKGHKYARRGAVVFWCSPIPVDLEPNEEGEWPAYGHISAVDYSTGDIAWRYYDPQPMAGTLGTAGGLVFTGSQTGHALGLNAETGEVVWQAARWRYKKSTNCL